MAKRPNILFMMADDHRHHAIRAFGDRTVETPVMDRLISRGTSFTQTRHTGSLSAAVCMPARAALHTGNHPFHSCMATGITTPGNWHDQGTLRPELTTMAEAFRNASPRHTDRALPGPLNLEQIPDLAARGHKRLAYFYERMNEALADRDFLVGESLTQADIDLRVVCDFAAIVKQKVPEDCPHLAAHQQRVAALIPLQV